MPSVVVTTICRHSLLNEPSGYVYTVDLEAGQVTGWAPIVEPPYREVDPNPRGGLRGGRGIAIHGEDLLISNNSAIYHYDSNWKLLNVISHPAFANIHDIDIHDNAVWVTASGNDMLLKLDLTGRLLRIWYMRDWATRLPELQWGTAPLLDPEDVAIGKINFRDPRAYHMERNDGAHVNSICFLPDGTAIILFGLVWTPKFEWLFSLKRLLTYVKLWVPTTVMVRAVARLFGKELDQKNEMGFAVARGRSALVSMSPAEAVRLCYTVDGVHVPSHSLRVLDDRSVICLNSSSGEIVKLDSDTWRESSRFVVTEKYLRGCVPLSRDRLVVGCQTEICVVNLHNKRVEQSITLSTNRLESVYDVRLLPPRFAPVPDRLPSQLPQGTYTESAVP